MLLFVEACLYKRLCKYGSLDIIHVHLHLSLVMFIVHIKWLAPSLNSVFELVLTMKPQVSLHIHAV